MHVPMPTINKTTTSAGIFAQHIKYCLTVAVAACSFTAPISGWAATDLPTDYAKQPIPRTAAAPTGRATAQHAYLFGGPAYWAAPLRWRYNHAGAPAQLAANKSATIQTLLD